MDSSATAAARAGRLRRLWLCLGLGGCVLLGVAYFGYWTHTLRYRQSTDDAYVSGHVVQITPQISGTVVGIGVEDTQFVPAGAPLVRLDQADAKVALDEAEADLAKTVREVGVLYATVSQLQAVVELRDSELAITCGLPVTPCKMRRRGCFPRSSSCGPAAPEPTARTSRIIPTCAARPPRCAAPILRTREPCCRRRWPDWSRSATCSSASG